MKTIHEILDIVKQNHKLPMLRIIETGTSSTIDIASWCANNPNSVFKSIDLNGIAQEANHAELEKQQTAIFCTFHTQDHKKYLTSLHWVDVAVLDPNDLQDGLEEFQLAASAGARVIIIKDFQTKASLATKQAKKFGWDLTYLDGYSIITRPGA